MPDEVVNMLLTGWLLAGGWMLILWAVHLRLKNAGIVDIGWAGGFGLVALTYFLMADGYGPRKGLATAMAVIWAVRLVSHLVIRTIGQEEDARYRQLRKEWGRHVGVKFFFFFQFQGMLDVVLSIPLLLAAVNPHPALSLVEWIGFGLWMIALVGESMADRQLRRFKSVTSDRSQVCRVGLWRYSRHPNYFFEWVVWLAFFVFALGSPYGILAAISPLLMLYFLFRVTGIPATEAQALRSKGEAYREYQRTTSSFVPWFPKTSRQIQSGERLGRGNS